MKLRMYNACFVFGFFFFLFGYSRNWNYRTRQATRDAEKVSASALCPRRRIDRVPIKESGKRCGRAQQFRCGPDRADGA